ncbi:MAG: DUF2116 family Zn-ribbon domain-containing protein [Candidatus Methanomethylophilaceae archaeon]
MALRLPEHSHCAYCGDPVRYGEEFCNDGCREKKRIDDRRTLVKDFVFYATVAAALVIIVYRYIL